ncbi:MAG TPA: hypothetical protein VL172_17175 [Kofleriaceae bacterium]|nr:hypothetical protein [Kofleriaceae bacterium]
MGHCFRAGAFAAAGALAAACGNPPAGGPDAAGPFEWTAVIDGIEPALLSACSEGTQATVVGGRDGDGLVLEWDGSTWMAAPLPSHPHTLWWCAGSGAGAWAVGEGGTVLRRGDTWVPVDTGGAVPVTAALYGVWTDGPTTWVVGGDATGAGARPVIARHTATGGWQAAATGALPDGTLFKVWGASATDVWAVGSGGLILRYQEGAWAAMPSPTDERLIAVWGTADDDVYAVGGESGGLVLRWDGASWTRFAAPPEPLSGVWRAAGGPLYVGGNRGWLGRFATAGGVPSATALTSTVALADVDVHALAGADGSVLAVGADLLGGGEPSWRGRLLVHGGGFGGELQLPPDGGITGDDGAPADAAADGGGGAGPGDVCPELPDTCADNLDCWLLLASNVAICTRLCGDASECTADFGADACCELPGFQAVDKVCIPGSYQECSPP